MGLTKRSRTAPENRRERRFAMAGSDCLNMPRLAVPVLTREVVSRRWCLSVKPVPQRRPACKADAQQRQRQGRYAGHWLQRRRRDFVHLGAALVVWVAAKPSLLLGEPSNIPLPARRNRPIANGGAHTAFAQAGLHSGHSNRLHASGRLQGDS